MVLPSLRTPQGVQFHPESCITEQGMDIMQNFLKIVAEGPKDLQDR